MEFRIPAAQKAFESLQQDVIRPFTTNREQEPDVTFLHSFRSDEEPARAFSISELQALQGHIVARLETLAPRPGDTESERVERITAVKEFVDAVAALAETQSIVNALLSATTLDEALRVTSLASKRRGP